MWRKNQKIDQFYQKAKVEGYRARSAYKLLEIQNKFNIIKPNSMVIDLGCAPGGWIQVAQQFTKNPVYGIDLLPVNPIQNTFIATINFLDTDKVDAFLGDELMFDIILSDLAPSTTGIRSVDHYKSMELIESVLLFAKKRINKGFIVLKLFDGPKTNDLIKNLRITAKTCIFKPESSRNDSKELFLICELI